MIETAENLRRDYRISPRGAGRVRGPLPPAGGRRSGIRRSRTRSCRCWSRTDGRDPSPRRAPARRYLVEILGQRFGRCAGRQDPDATVTAGNASGQNDGAAACIVTHPEEAADRYGLTPARPPGGLDAGGVAPAQDGHRPGPGDGEGARGAGLALKDMDLIELNEAFAAQVLACTREWRFAPPTSTGSTSTARHLPRASRRRDRRRILATLLREMAGATRATGWRPCASAAARASPPSSRESDHPQQHEDGPPGLLRRIRI